MFASLLCNPPLGQTTIVTNGRSSVRFTVVIESATERPWEVALWHNFHGHDEWSSLTLESLPAPGTAITVKSYKSDVHRQWYAGELRGYPKHRRRVSFTVTFRASKDEPWKWSNEQFSTSDGHIIYEASDLPSEELTHYLHGLPPYLDIQKQTSDTPGALVWSVDSPVQAASGTTSGYSKNKLGLPSDFSRWFALVRLWSPWLAPRQGKGQFRPDKEAILATFERNDGTHLALLAVSGVDDVLTTLHHDGSGNIIINSENDAEQNGVARLVVAVGIDLESAVAATVYYARRIVLKYEAASGELAAEQKAQREGVKPEWLETWSDGLAYCTWNGLGQDLTEQKIFEALDSLSKNDINITSLIIDDNWQSLDDKSDQQFGKGWMEFEATKTGFPRGLQATVRDIRARHRNIKHVAVWHAIFGYWGGISPEGKIAQEYKTTWVKKKNGVSGGKMLVVAQEDAGRLYNDFYRFLSSAGVDSVKTDAQFFLDELDDPRDRRNLIQTYQDVWSINQLRYFSGKAISCMSQAPQIIFHSQLPPNKPRILLRNSDDFFPEVPASHPWHIFANAHNAIFTQHLNILPDWDMFQTGHSYGSYHAAARCVSGGPIYITDKPGYHDIGLIRQMTGNTPRGDTVIFRPHTVGKTTSVYNSYDDPALLKVSTYVGMARTGVSVLGVFNCTQAPVSELISLNQFPGAEEGTYVVRSHTTGQLTKPSTAGSDASFIHVELPVQGWEILSAFPVRTFELERRHPGEGPTTVSVANLGLLGKMTGAAAIINYSSYIERSSGRLRIWTSLKALGTYGIYVSDLPKRSLEEDFIALIFGRPIPLDCISINDACADVLEIDTVRAWKETGASAGWSNEVAVEVVIR